MQHKFDWLIAYPDTDAAGIVYHANYLNLADRARTSWFISQNINFVTQDYLLVVASAKLDFKAPARLLDNICVISSIGDISAAKICLTQNIFCEDKILCNIKIELACINAQKFKPIKIPKELREKLVKFINS